MIITIFQTHWHVYSDPLKLFWKEIMVIGSIKNHRTLIMNLDIEERTK